MHLLHQISFKFLFLESSILLKSFILEPKIWDSVPNNRLFNCRSWVLLWFYLFCDDDFFLFLIDFDMCPSNFLFYSFGSGAKEVLPLLCDLYLWLKIFEMEVFLCNPFYANWSELSYDLIEQNLSEFKSFI